jgi:murein DD-endopeptidase MepM/ murein hydrolase activator NlpD
MIVVVLGAIVSVPAISHSPASTPSPTEIALATDTPTDSPTLSPSPSPSPTPVPTPEPRVGNPLDGTSFLAYTVRSGDTLIRIAESFGLSTTSLYWANSSLVKDPQLVKIGQTLYIPPVDGLTVTVKDGDTVQSIADKYGIDPNELVAANGMSDQLLVTGQLLLVPGADTPPLPVKQVPVPTPRPVNWFRKLVWPVVAHHNITQYFGCTGWPGEPRYGSCAHWHSGVDVGAPTGTAVVAAASGKVIYAGWRKRGTDGAAGGIVVWMSHGNGTLYTTYNHLSGVTVRIGQTVKAGQQVGKVGSTGASSGSHLHFEVWIAYPWTGGTYAEVRNPLLYTIYRP